MELIYIQTELKGLSSPEPWKKEREEDYYFFDLAGSEVYDIFHGRFQAY